MHDGTIMPYANKTATEIVRLAYDATPAEIVRLGGEALVHIDGSDEYVFIADLWHRPNMYDGHDENREHPLCGVCLAGAVMAAHFDAPLEMELNGIDCPPKIRALDLLLHCNLSGFLAEFGVEADDSVKKGVDSNFWRNRGVLERDLHATSHNEPCNNTPEFRQALELLADELDAGGYQKEAKSNG